METLNQRHWLVGDPQGFDPHTDHSNLIAIFDPTPFVTEISQTTVRKVLWWDMKFSIYNYMCIHITGRENVWVDLLGHWSAPHPTIHR